jgi:hypothetical protein
MARGRLGPTVAEPCSAAPRRHTSPPIRRAFPCRPRRGALRGLLLAASLARMKTQRDQRTTVRLAGALLSELEQAANEDRRPVADLIRGILINWAMDRLARHTEAADAA